MEDEEEGEAVCLDTVWNVLEGAAASCAMAANVRRRREAREILAFVGFRG